MLILLRAEADKGRLGFEYELPPFNLPRTDPGDAQSFLEELLDDPCH
jgi:hypothetical protein